MVGAPMIRWPRRGRSRVRWGTLLGSVAAAAAVVVGVVAFVVGGVVHGHLLTAGLYTDALTQRQAYRRVYSEILVDPAVRDATNELLGELGLDPAQRRDVIAVSNAVLRLALPPDALDDLVDQLLRQALAYVRGDVEQLRTDLSVLGALDRTDEAGAVIMRRALTATSEVVLPNFDAYVAAVRAFLDDLAAGQLPTMLPVSAEPAPDDEHLATAIEEAAPRPLPGQVRDQVTAAVQNGDERDALIAAGTSAPLARFEAAISRLVAGDDLRVDVLDAVGAASPSARREVTDRLADLRAAMRWLPSWTRAAGAGLAVAGAAGLVALHRRRLWLGLATTGGALLAGGAASLLLWDSQRRRFASPLAAAAAGGMPSSARTLLVEVNQAVTASLGDTVVAHVVWPAALGGLFVVAGALGAAKTAIAAPQRVRWLTAAVALTVAVVVTVLTTARPDDGARPLARACNGHAELCDRPYDEIVQAATHNAMSSPEIVRIWPEQDADVRGQLDFGIRTLMIDAAYWTAVRSAGELGVPDLPDDVGAALLDLLRDRLDPRPGVYACHNICAFGSRPLHATLRTVREFLDANPDEVVTLILQDSISRADATEAFDEAGLTDIVFDGDVDDGWPTLGELIDRGQRLVVFSEQRGPPPTWYRQAFTLIQDTPHAVTAADQFSCERDRGPVDAPLFLMNHWVRRRAPDRADAVVVNDRAFIVERAQRCAAERGKLPNFIAVDFFSLGDVIGAVDELNGVADRHRAPAPPRR